MIEKLRKNPLGSALIVTVVYGTIIFGPALLGMGGDGQPATPAEEAISEWPIQVTLIIFLTAVVAVLAWWKQVGFTSHTKGTLKFLILPILYTGLFFTLGIVFGKGASIAGTTGFGQLLALLLVTLMVGYTEETMFRGILFFGSTERFTLLWGAIISAIIFGLFHYLNMIGGQGFGITTSQVVHAFSVGFMYASLRLMTGSLWPVMLLHALWDFSILSMQSAMMTAGGEIGAGLSAAQVGGVSISPIQVLPGLLYGAFVFWRWTVRSKKETA